MLIDYIFETSHIMRLSCASYSDYNLIYILLSIIISDLNDFFFLIVRIGVSWLMRTVFGLANGVIVLEGE